MENNYVILDDCFIFVPEFNEQIDNYINLIINKKKLIFSNYIDANICIESNNNFIGKYFENFKRSKFNKPLSNSFKKLSNLKHFTFGCEFNQPLVNSLDKLINLTHLTFGEYFNQSLVNSLDKLINLTHLTFGENFNQSLVNLLEKITNLTHLTLGYKYNEKVILSYNIKILTINCNNLYLIENLSNGIEELNLNYNFNLDLKNLPNSIKKITFEVLGNYNKKLLNLPKLLKELKLSKNYKNEIIIPSGCKLIKN